MIVRPSVKALAQARRKRLAPNKAQAAAAPGAKPAPAAKAAAKPDKK